MKGMTMTCITPDQEKAGKGSGIPETVRAVQRALNLIRVMNSRETWTLHELALASMLAKTTVHRLLATLQESGYVHNPPGKAGLYRLTSQTCQLSAGLTAATRYADAADPIVVSTTLSLEWPVSFAIAEPPFMRIVSCGMPHSPAHSAKPTSIGARHWMFSSAVGRAYLSRCSANEVELVRSKGEAFRDSSDVELHVPALPSLREDMANVRAKGYAIRVATRSDLNSALAVPVHQGDHVVGSLACTTFPHSLSDQFIASVMAGLRRAADEIALTCPG
jgi:IclR family transcriptional regulator, mhp operon transcriptional activator